MTGPSGEILRVNPDELRALAQLLRSLAASMHYQHEGEPMDTSSAAWGDPALRGAISLTMGGHLCTQEFVDRMLELADHLERSAAAYENKESENSQQLQGVGTDGAKAFVDIGGGVAKNVADIGGSFAKTITDTAGSVAKNVADTGGSLADAAGELIGDLGKAGGGGHAQPLDASHLNHGGLVDQAVVGPADPQPQGEHPDNPDHERTVK